MNNGTGFDSTPTGWTLPVAPVSKPAPYAHAAQSDAEQTCADGTQPGAAFWSYAAFDLTGDGRVLTQTSTQPWA